MKTGNSGAHGDRGTPGLTVYDSDETVLYEVVAERLETFLARARQRDRPAPRFVEREFRRFLECGIFAHGFLRVHCDTCGHDRWSGALAGVE